LSSTVLACKSCRFDGIEAYNIRSGRFSVRVSNLLFDVPLPVFGLGSVWLVAGRGQRSGV